MTPNTTTYGGSISEEEFKTLQQQDGEITINQQSGTILQPGDNLMVLREETNERIKVLIVTCDANDPRVFRRYTAKLAKN